VATDLSVLVPLLAQNYHASKEGSRWWSNDASACREGASFLCASDDAVLDPSQLKDLAKKVRQESSRLAGGVGPVVAVRAALSSDPLQAVHLAKVAWDVMKVRPFAPGPHLSLAAVVLAERATLDDFGLVAQRARDFHSAQRAEHSIITSADDCIPSLLLALTPMEVPTGAALVEEVYQTVKPWFGYNEAQALAQVLVVGGAHGIDPGPLLALRNALDRDGVKVSGPAGSSLLGLLALVSSDHQWLSRSAAQTSADLGALKVLSGRFAKTSRDTLAMALVAVAMGDEAQVQQARAVYLNIVAGAVAEEQAATASAAR
jgi:hypothetical protein